MNTETKNVEIMTMEDLDSEVLKIQDALKSSGYVEDVSYESYRDGFRFNLSLIVFFMFMSFCLLITSSILISKKKESATYTTDRKGLVEKIYGTDSLKRLSLKKM